MAYFDDRFYNPAYINPAYYEQMKNTIQQTNQQVLQNGRVMKAAHAFSDMLDQIDEMDIEHQKQLFGICLAEIARRRRWG